MQALSGGYDVQTAATCGWSYNTLQYSISTAQYLYTVRVSAMANIDYNIEETSR